MNQWQKLKRALLKGAKARGISLTFVPAWTCPFCGYNPQQDLKAVWKLLNKEE